MAFIRLARAGLLLLTIGFLFAFSMPNFAAIPDVAQVNFSSESTDLLSGVYFYPDIHHHITIHQILESGDIKWRRAKAVGPNFGFSEATYWFKVSFQNSSEQVVEGLFEMDSPLLDEVSVYPVFDGQLRDDLIVQLGDHLPFSNRAILHRNFLLPLSVGPGQECTLYISVKTGSAIQLPVRFWNEQAFHSQDITWLLGQGVFYGVMLVMAMYNLLIYISVRDSNYLYYVAYVISFSLSIASIQGLGYQYLWPHNIAFQDKCVAVWVSCALIFAGVFTSGFLEIKHSHPWLHRAIVATICVAVLNLLVLPFVPYFTVIKLLLGLTGFGAALFILAGVWVWNRGIINAHFYLVAWLAMFAGVLALIASKMGWVPRTALTEYFGQLGMLLDVILLSFGLADRVNRERSLKYKAQSTALEHEQACRVAEEEILQAHKAAELQLSEKVVQRSEELHRAMAELSMANIKLKELSNIDGLTGVRSRRYFDAMIERELTEAQNTGKPLAIIMSDIDCFKQLNDTYGHLLGDECLRRVAAIIQSVVTWPADAVSRFGGEEFAIVLPNTSLISAQAIAEKLRKKLEREILEIEGRELKVTLSLGVSGVKSATHKDSSKRLISEADQALYSAKNSGRNRVCVAS